PVIEVPFDAEFNLPARLAKTGAALTIVCNPNAPSGTLVPVEELGSLAEELKGRGVLLIDEAYVDFAPRSCASLVKNFENVIVLRSMSKGYSLAGLRFGYGIACRKLVEGLLKGKDSYNVDAISIAAATAAIRDQPYFSANAEKVKAERASLIASLRSIGLEALDSHANFVLVRIGGAAAKRVCDELAARGIYVRYFAELSDRLRISVGTAEQNGRLLEAIEQILQRCKT
ncbi:MAG TPA: histidinol-phosphate transaminase, partial [Sedimentisphaerales bacterium]|nr:histidinol-phosphate transaminase [Sedimentisphaerales bacterium]